MDSTSQALLIAVLQSLHALQKALASLPTGLHCSVHPAAAEGTHHPVPSHLGMLEHFV